ncbi:MAG: hypothetical protein K6T35_08305, partial [Meiothermus silvanus]|nr:hypothetical protein [Allomeiothermus silvanus]
VQGQVVVARFRAGRKRLALRAVKGMVNDPHAARPDRRVADAKGWLERFLASAEEVRASSRLEREEELAGNPHFSEGLISHEVVERLERAGYRVDPHRLEELASLVDGLPAREERFMELVQQALEEESDEKARAILEQVLAQGPQFSANEVNRLLKKLTLPKAAMHALTASLQEVAALRGLKYELHRAGFSPVRAVAYRDSSGEVVYTAPVYGR